MRAILCVLVAAFIYGAAAGHGQTPQAAETTITFQSSSYSDFRQLLARNPVAGTVSVQGKLSFPEQAKDRYPTVVVLHSLAGYREDNEGYVAAVLRKSGFATLTYDSFAARGTTGMAMSGSAGYLTAGVADAFAALERLASEPRIDRDRIAILGFSYGGEVAHVTAFEPLRSVLVSGKGRFAAHVAFYPAGNFGVAAAAGAYTGSPVLMLLGGKDDNLPVAKIEEYLAYAHATGNPAPVKTLIYPGAYHAWTVPRLGAPRFYPEYVSTKNCPLILLGPSSAAVLSDGQAKPFDPSAFAACIAGSPGYSMGFDAAVRDQSVTEALRFLTENLHL